MLKAARINGHTKILKRRFTLVRPSKDGEIRPKLEEFRASIAQVKQPGRTPAGYLAFPLAATPPRLYPHLSRSRSGGRGCAADDAAQFQMRGDSQRQRLAPG